MKKKILCIAAFVFAAVILAGVFYRFVPVKKMPINNNNMITAIKDYEDLVIGYKLNGKNFYKDDFLYGGFNTSDYNIEKYDLLFKEKPVTVPLYEKENKSLKDLKVDSVFYLIYDNIIVEDIKCDDSDETKFIFYITSDFKFPEFKAENFEKIEVIEGYCEERMDTNYTGIDEFNNITSRIDREQKSRKVIDTINDTEKMQIFLKKYDSVYGSNRFSAENYPNQEVYYRISFKDQSFPMWFVINA